MVRVGEMAFDENGIESPDAAVTKVWYRCSRCHHNTLVDEASLYTRKETVEVKTLSRDECITYLPANSYNIGDAIYHSEWDDIGKVKNKLKTSDGGSAIIVEFQRLGERRLVDNFNIEPSAPEIEQ